MRTLWTVAVATALATISAGVPAAQAGPISKYHGGCSMLATADATGAVIDSEQFMGVMTVSVVPYSTGEPDTDPVSATVRCWVEVNGWTQLGAVMTRSGAGLVVGASELFYLRNSLADDVRVCTLVDYTSDSTPTSVDCRSVTTFELPPPLVHEVVDPLVCPGFAAVPGQIGPLLVTPQGDVHVNGSLLWDCPPSGISSVSGRAVVDLLTA